MVLGLGPVVRGGGLTSSVVAGAGDVLGAGAAGLALAWDASAQERRITIQMEEWNGEMG